MRPRPTHVVLLAFSLLVGCTGSSSTQENDESQGHASRPESYPAGISQLKAFRDDVESAFEAGTPEACDDALHEVAHLLDVLPEIAAAADMPQEDREVVASTSQELFGHFMKIHEGFHGSGEGSSFDAVAEDINSAIHTLESKVGVTGETHHATDGHLHEGEIDTDHVHAHDHEHE